MFTTLQGSVHSFTLLDIQNGPVLPMLWHCPQLHIFWAQVLGYLEDILGVIVQNNPRAMILHLVKGWGEELGAAHGDAMHMILPLAVTAILKLWVAADLPTLFPFLVEMGWVRNLETKKLDTFDTIKEN